MFSVTQSEICILGAIFMDGDVLKRIRHELTPKDFSSPKNMLVYQAMLNLDAQGKPITPTTVMDVLGDTGGKVTGNDIGDILQSIITSTGTSYHVQAIKANRIKSQLISISNFIADKNSKTNPKDLLEESKRLISDIHVEDVAQPVQAMTDLLPDVYASLEVGQSYSIPTGFTDLDRMIAGWNRGDLIVVAGRPGMGKSILAKEFAEAAGVPVLFFSLEMPTSQLIKRQLSAHSGVSYASIRRAELQDAELDRVKRAADALMRIPIAYSDKANMSISEIMATCETYRRQNELGMVVIDYLQLIRADSKIEHREREVAQISQRLKTMARDLDVPVICLAQLNRSCETRGGDKQPQLSDLRESGAIEQDADTVIFVWREAMYVKKRKEDGAMNDHDALLIVAKGRNTGTGAIQVFFDGAHQKFANLYWDERGEMENGRR